MEDRMQPTYTLHTGTHKHEHTHTHTHPKHTYSHTHERDFDTDTKVMRFAAHSIENNILLL